MLFTSAPAPVQGDLGKISCPLLGLFARVLFRDKFVQERKVFWLLGGKRGPEYTVVFGHIGIFGPIRPNCQELQV